MAIDQTNQYLTFTLDESLFALSIDKVREVLELSRITRIPRMPGFLRGVINVRGHAVPVADMRQKFELPEANDTVDTCIIIVDVAVEGERSTIGALVDAVNEVAELPDDAVEAPPRMGLAVNAAFIRGMARRNDDFVMILDVDKIFSSEEVAAMGEAGILPENESEEAVA
ncbi:MAG: chemotaxis protein CheW [Oceanidesulfovibrio sp.]